MGRRLVYDEKRAEKTAIFSLLTGVCPVTQFVCQYGRWAMSDKSGSGNTANIGSIHYIPDILAGNGMFRNLGELWFDDYWMNYGVITITNKDGKTKKITKLEDFVTYRGGDPSLIIHKPKKPARRKKKS